MPKTAALRLRELLFLAPFTLFGLITAAAGLVQLIATPPASWLLVITVIVGVIVCSPLYIGVGRTAGPPFVGATITMLAIHPVPERPFLGPCIWTIGYVIALLIARRNAIQTMYMAGLSAAAAFAFVGTEIGLSAVGVPLWPAYIAAAAAYYAPVLLIACARQRMRPANHREFSIGSLSPARIALLIFVVGTTAALMNYIDDVGVAWLERNSDVVHTPTLVLLVAIVLYLLSQRMRNAEVERRLNAVVNAAVDLPRETPESLATTLQQRAQSIVQATEIDLRSSAPERNEIGAAVNLETGSSLYLVAGRKVGDAPFVKEDQQALATLAHMASEAARVQYEVDSLERRANSDPLTDLPNYGAFQRALSDANENRPYHEGIAMLFIDIDNFKTFNDSHGHRAGDELLRAVANRLRKSAGGGDFVARVGGDEFVVILRDLVSPEQAKESAEQIVAAVSRPLRLDGQDMRPSVSAGLAYSSHRELDPQTLVEDADRTMLKAKRSRREGDTGLDASVSLSSHKSTRTNEIVARAINENRLELAFQPIVDIAENRIWAFESLVRYIDPEIGPISPPSLVARAKSLGLLNDLTTQIIAKSLIAAEEFRQIDSSLDCITVNLELAQISDAELGPFIRQAAQEYPDISLCIELNERSLRFATDSLRQEAEQLQEAGVIIALDDYGSEDSSVGALVHFPMNILKIDKSLISNLDDIRQREVLRALQGFGDNLNYKMVVEGIESAEMSAVMTELGVRNAQGYYYGRPLSKAFILERLRRSGVQAFAE